MTETILVSRLSDTEPLIDGRVLQTYDVIGYPGLLVRCHLRYANGELRTESQYFETATGRRFTYAVDAVAAWEAEQPAQIEVGSIPVSQPAPTVDASIQARRFVSRSVIPSRLKALSDAGIAYELIQGDQYLVAGCIEFYPATGFWRSRSVGTPQGYHIGRLIFEARQAQQKPAKGRDSAAPNPSTQTHAVAESLAGDNCETSSSRLPAAVWP
jgi:hypothetical protein